jgi:uncharacterized protein YjbI with pentapeptide repeats
LDWDTFDAIGEFIGAVGSLVIACIVAYIAVRQWLDGRRFDRERRELTEEIERKNEVAKQEQERIIRAQSLDAYFDGISNLLLRDGAFGETARNLTKGRTDAILKVLKSDEKRNLVAFLYGSGLITLDGDNSLPVVGLSGSDLSGVELSGSTLRKASLSMVNLRGAQISEADLDEADLRGADLREADLRGADLSRANLHGAVAAAANLSGVDLSEADMSGADLRGGDFSGADLSGSNLSGANLRGADLSGADLRGANLSGANLREAILTDANLLEARLTNLISIDSADFTEVMNLAAETRGYLCSIASGAHPNTGRDTRATLGCS